MKTTMKKLAAGTFITLLVLVVNVKAEGTETKASDRENFESALSLEDWMTDETIWNLATLNNDESANEAETVIGVEDWMVNPETWNFNNDILVETETVLELESWMTDSETWNASGNNTETGLEVENWMINNRNWK